MINIKRLKEVYTPGKRLKCIMMFDSYSVPPGTKGTIEYVDDQGTIFVDWDNGQSLGLIYGVDRFVECN